MAGLTLAAVAAGSESSSRVPDTLRLSFKQTPDWAVRCTSAVVLKLEEKSDLKLLKSITNLEKVGSNQRYEIRLRDTWDETFTIECTLDGALISESSHRVPLRFVPKVVRDAADEWAPGAEWNSTAEAETLRGRATTYQVRGELGGKSIKAVIDESGTIHKASKLPAEVQQTPRKKKMADAPVAAANKDAKEEPAAQPPPAVTSVLERPVEKEPEHDPSIRRLPQNIREPFARRFPTGCVLKTRQRNESWMKSVISFDGTVAELHEVTASDRYNKELKLVYRLDGKLYSAERHFIPLEHAPEKAREAASNWAGTAALSELARVEMPGGEPQVLTFTAKLNGKKYQATFNEFGAEIEADKLPRPK